MDPRLAEEIVSDELRWIASELTACAGLLRRLDADRHAGRATTRLDGEPVTRAATVARLRAATQRLKAAAMCMDGEV